MPTPKPIRMTADRFVAWAMEQPDCPRYELASGEIIAKGPKRTAHARVKINVRRALSDSILATSSQREALPDGMAVRIDDATVYEPDAAVRCGTRPTDDAVEFDDPVVVVEVLSASAKARDTGARLEDYFRLRSMWPYLIVKTDSRCVIHHRRSDNGAIATSIRNTGSLRLDPPGIGIQINDIFANPDS